MEKKVTYQLGIEIELEKAPKLKNKIYNYWIAKEDGSLRDGGVELVFAQPYKSPIWQAALDEAYKDIDTLPDTCVSPRTGLHVHMDAGDMNIASISKLCTIYSILEEPIFNWVGEYRQINTFCLPWYDADADITHIGKMLGGDYKRLTNNAGILGRYSALNLSALRKFGSIEFRHLKTTKNKQKVVSWANFILDLKAAAICCEHSPANILSIFTEEGPTTLIKTLFNNDLPINLDFSTIKIGPTIALDLINNILPATEAKKFFAHLIPAGVNEGYRIFSESHSAYSEDSY